MQNLLIGLALGGYLGGLIASIPLALSMRPHWGAVALVSVGWFVLLLGMATGLVRLDGGLGTAPAVPPRPAAAV